jgi:hypothetical protein
LVFLYPPHKRRHMRKGHPLAQQDVNSEAALPLTYYFELL